MLKPISRVEEIFRDTTVHKAETTRIDEVTSLHGFDRPPWLTETNWRKAVSKTAFGPRGASHTLFLFLRHALHQFSEKIKCAAFSKTTDHAVAFEKTSGFEGFTNRHINRLCVLINDTTKEEYVLYSIGGAPKNSLGVLTNVSPYLTFAPKSSHLYDAAPKKFAPNNKESFTLFVLPFLIFELTPSAVYVEPEGNVGGANSIPELYVGSKKHGALIRVRLFNTNFVVPGTFVQEITSSGQAVELEPFVPPKEVGGPTGGYLMEDITKTQYNEGNFDFPIYLGEGLNNLDILLDVLRKRFLAAGVRIEFEIFPLQDF